MAKTCLRCGVHLLDSEECTCLSPPTEKAVDNSKAKPAGGAGCFGLVLVAGAMMVWFSIDSPKPGSSSQNQTVSGLNSGVKVVEPVVEAEPHEAVTLPKWTWEKGGFGSIFLGSFTVSNQNSYAVKDVKIGCLLFGKSGTELGSVAEVIYDSIPPGKALRITKLNMGFMPQQSSSVTCKVVKAERAQ